VYGRLAVFDAADMQRSRAAELDLGPLKIADFLRPQTMSESDQDQRGVPVTVATALGGLFAEPRAARKPRIRS
jgi:hypothetical protein